MKRESVMNQTLNVLAGGCRANMHKQAPDDMTQDQIGEGSPCTVSIGSDAYGTVVGKLRRNSQGRIAFVSVQLHAKEIQFRLRKGGQLRSAGSGSYGLSLGFAEDDLDPSF